MHLDKDCIEMTKHISLAIALTVTTFLSAPAIAASLTPTLGTDSVFAYGQGTVDDYNFTSYKTDAAGHLTTEYYKVAISPEKLATSANLRWTAGEKGTPQSVTFKILNGKENSFQYNYDENSGRVYTERQTDLAQQGSVTADFIGISYIYNAYNHFAEGGSINNAGTIEKINGDFVANYAQNNSDAVMGGVIYNTAMINDINGNFVANHINGRFIEGNTIYNKGTIENITGSFIANYGVLPQPSSSKFGTTDGGTVYNKGTIGNIKGDFIANTTQTVGTQVNAGAIYNIGAINSLSGDFIANTISTTNSVSWGGAIVNVDPSEYPLIGKISGNFIGNYAKGVLSSSGGAIYNYHSKIGDISGDFIANHISGDDTYFSSSGGAVYNSNKAEIGIITGDFIGNYAENAGSAYGGAIYNSKSVIKAITGNFLGNYISSGDKSRGGAVYTNGDMAFVSGVKTHFFSDNYLKYQDVGKIYNALYATASSTVTFDTAGGGAWVINDNMEGGNYTFKGNDAIDASAGTTTQYVAMNNDIVNAANVKVEGTTLRFDAYQHEDQTAKNWDGKGAFVASLKTNGTANRDAAAVTNLSLNNGVFDIANGYLETVKLKSYSATDSFLHIDVDVENMKADELHIAGDVEGVTKMIVYASSDADIRNRGQILFAQSENDTTGNEGSFVVSRVYKSPYLFDVKYDQIADNSNKWYFEMNDQPNEEPKEPEKPDVPDVPDVPTPELPDVPPVKPQPLPGSDRPVAPEVIGAESLPAAGLAQTSNMIYNIMQKVSSNRFYCPGCGFYDYYWNGEAFHNLWANAVYNTLRIKTPTDIDAEVWGIEAGGDLQHDLNNKLGLFLSYRKGNYDMNGDGKHHYSTVGSEIDIDSYLAGLYYRYDRNNWWSFATVYGGIQRVDLKTKDGIKSDTDGTEFGGSVELGYDYAINKTVYLTPSVGAFYTQVDYDDATDSAGKIAKYNTLRQLELEAGVKLTKAFVTDEGYANVYVKPSVVRTLTDGDEVRITGLGKVNTLEDQTLGRVEIGGRYGFTEQLSTYGWANHTFGDDYKASTFGLGLSYNW